MAAKERFRFITHARNPSYLFLKNWWGFRHGSIWTYKQNGHAWLLDLGCFTVGIISKARDF